MRAVRLHTDGQGGATHCPDAVAAGDEVFALTPFDRDGVAADYAAVAATVLAPRPRALTHVESAALPLPG